MNLQADASLAQTRSRFCRLGCYGRWELAKAVRLSEVSVLATVARSGGVPLPCRLDFDRLRHRATSCFMISLCCIPGPIVSSRRLATATVRSSVHVFARKRDVLARDVHRFSSAVRSAGSTADTPRD